MARLLMIILALSAVAGCGDPRRIHFDQVKYVLQVQQEESTRPDTLRSRQGDTR